MERIKVVMQTQDQNPASSKRYTGMMDAGRGMWAEGGLMSLYRGTIATLARVSLESKFRMSLVRQLTLSLMNSSTDY